MKKSYITPAIIFAVILGLISFGVNAVCDNIKDNKQQIQEVKKDKVDNKTLQLMLENQQIQFKMYREQTEKREQLNDKKFDVIFDKLQKVGK